MRALSASELLEVWERGLVQGPVERALTLWGAACPETPREGLAALSIGRRDAGLLTLREWTFGPQLASLATCPHCGQQLELTFNVEDIRVTPAAEPAAESMMTVAGYELQFRPPNSMDIAAAVDGSGTGRERRTLFERCLMAARWQGEPATPDELPPEVVDAMVDGMAAMDPQADIELSILCPSCGQRWHAVFDIVSFFWSEIDAWARRILREVHVLASAYGWGEREILALSPWRRQLYLEMVGG
ncbi:MAG: phage baseplate protein [Terriglobia bacterium]